MMRRLGNGGKFLLLDFLRSFQEIFLSPSAFIFYLKNYIKNFNARWETTRVQQ